MVTFTLRIVVDTHALCHVTYVRGQKLSTCFKFLTPDCLFILSLRPRRRYKEH